MKKDIKLLASEFEFFEILEKHKLNHQKFEAALIAADEKFEDIKYSIEISFRKIIPDIFCHSLRAHGFEKIFNNIDFLFALDQFLWRYYNGLLRCNDICDWEGFKLPTSALSLPRLN